MPTTTVNLNVEFPTSEILDFPVIVTVSWCEGERQTWDYPGCPAHLDGIEAVKFDVADIRKRWIKHEIDQWIADRPDWQEYAEEVILKRLNDSEEYHSDILETILENERQADEAAFETRWEEERERRLFG